MKIAEIRGQNYLQSRFMIFAAHFLLYSADADADRRFFCDTLGWPAVDAGEGWLIMACPPTEIGVHPTMSGHDPAASHDGLAPVQLYLMTDDVKAEVKAMKAKKVPVTKPENMGFGLVSFLTLPSGSLVGLYQPLHPIAAGKKAKRRPSVKSDTP